MISGAFAKFRRDGTGRGDEARHGGSPDQRDARPRTATPDGTELARPRDILLPDLHLDWMREGAAVAPIRVRARNFRSRASDRGA